MKRVTKIAAILTAVAMLMLLPDANVFTAKAAEPVSYAAKYDPDRNDWRMQENTSVFDENAISRSIYAVVADIKDGDIVVVYNDASTTTALDLGGVHLTNLTLAQNTQFCIIKTGGIDECYVLGGSYSSINGAVTNAYVYDTTTCTFTGNVGTLTIYAASDGSTSNVSVGGTVEHLYVTPLDVNVPRTFYNLYRFNEASLDIKDGKLQTPEWNYLNYDQYMAQATGTQNNNTANSTAASNNNQAASSSSDEYDDVPKTGQNSPYIWYLGAAVLFFAGSYALRRINR